MNSITVTAADVSLYHVAAVQLGDATQWWRIAVANNLVDPMIASGPQTLLIPDTNPSALVDDGLPPQS